MADENTEIQEQTQETTPQQQSIQFEDILPWGTTGGDTGLSSRLKLKRNFEKIKAWMDTYRDEKKVDVDWFSKLFVVHGTKTVISEPEEEGGDPVTTVEEVTIAPNEWPEQEDGITITGIEVKYSLWTNFFLSALGKNTSGGGGGDGGASRLFDLVDVLIPEILTADNDGQALVYDFTLGKWTNKKINGGATLNEPLAGINRSALGAPSQDGVGIVWNGSAWVYRAINAGSVTSVGLTVPTGFVVNGSPVTSSGTIGLAFADGYSLPTTAKQNNWDTAYLWGNHATAGYALASEVYSKADADAKFMTIAAFENLFNALNSSDQKVSHPYSSGVASIKAMVGLWTEQYLSALGKSDSGTSGVSLLGDLLDVRISNPTAGQVLKYRVVGGVGEWYNGNDEGVSSVAWENITGKPTTLAGYGITDAATASSLNNYLPLSAGSSKPLTGSLYLSSRSKGIFGPYSVGGSSVNIPLIYDNGENLWIGSVQTQSTHHIGSTYISAGHNGTSGNDTIYVCVPNAANTGGTNYGVLHMGNYSATLDTRYVTLATAQTITGVKTFTPQQTFTNGIKIGPYEIVADPGNGGLHIKGGLYADTYVSALGLSDESDAAFDETAMWETLARNGNQQIAASHLSSALAPYALTSQIPTIPTSLKNPYALTITLNGNETSYDGSVARSLTINTGLDTTAADARYLKLDGTNTMTGVLTVKASQYTDDYAGALNMANSNIYNVNGIYTSDLADGASEGINFYRDTTHVDSLWIKNGVMYFTPNRELGTSGTSQTILHTGNWTSTINLTSLGAASASSLNNYLPLTAGSTKPLTGSLYFSSRSKGIFEPYTFGGASESIPLIYDNGTNLWIGATQTTDQQMAFTHHIGRTYISAGHDGSAGNPTIYICVPNADNTDGTNHAVLHLGNSYVSSGKGYIFNSEITTISGNAATASRLVGTGTYTAWGQTYWQNGVPQSVVGDLRMLPSGGNTNSNSAKIEFRTLANNDEYIYGPYIQAINVNNYGRKRLSVFQKSEADWTTEQTEVFTILPNGNVGIDTINPSEKLDVNGNIKTATGNGTYIQIGGIRLVYEYESNALKVVKSDGTSAANFYATGGVSALGLNDTGGAAFDVDAMWEALGRSGNQQINSSHLTTALSPYALKTDIPTLSTLSWSYGSVTSASGNSYNGSASRSFVIPKATSHLTNDSGFITSASLGSYLPLTGGTLTGLLSIATGLGIQDVTGNGLLCYHPTNWSGVTSSQWGVGAVDSQGVIRSNANDLKHYRGGTLYNILDNYNSSISDSTITINGTSINAVRHIEVGTDNLDGYSGSFFFGGNATLQSGYDYVGFQAGNSLDKWQIVGINGLRWRQNDSGGTNTANWTDWKTLLDSSNFSNYARPKNRVQQTGINSGWYQVATVNTYSSLLLAVGGGWNNAAATLATFYITHHHSTDYITQVGTSYLGFVSKVRLRRISGGYIGIDVYVSSDTSSLVCAEIISLDSRPTIVMTQFETPTEGTSVAEVNVVGRDNFGYLPLSGGTLTGNLVLSNGYYIKCKTSDGTENISLGVNSSNQFFVGFGPAGKGCDTFVDGNNLYLRYGTSRTTGILLNSSGNVGVGTTSPSYKLHVNGSAKVNDLWIGDIHITYDQDNGGLYVGGGVAASTYMSALGTNSGGAGVSLNEPLSRINNAGLGTPSSSGVAIVWDGSKWKYGTTSSGTVTSVGMSVPTGFKVSGGSSQTISSSGTFALTFANGYSLPTTVRQNNWDDAYNLSHCHDNMSVLNGITSTKVSNWDTAHDMRHSHDNLTVLNGITSTKVSNWDTAYANSHTHSNKSVLDGITAAMVTKWNACVNSSEVTTQMRNYAYISSGVIHIGDSSITPLTRHQTVSGSFWGKSWTNGGTVSGNMSNVGNISSDGGYVSGFYGIDFKGVSGDSPNGGFLDFHYDGSSNDYTTRIIEKESGILSLLAPNVCGLMVGGYSGDYVQIGQIRIVYDYSNNALKVMHSNGGAANLYAVGGISALGISSNSGGYVNSDLLPATTQSYSLGSSSNRWKNLYLGKSGTFSIEPSSDDIRFITSRYFYFQNNVYMDDHLTVGGDDGVNTSYKFYVDGSSYLSGKLSIGGTNSNSDKLYVNGSVRASSYNNTSDVRLKDIISNEDIDLETIARAPVVRFTWKNNDDQRVHWGTLAQYWRGTEISDIVEDGQYLSMDYAATALASVISVARKVMTHEERIKALEKENKRLRNEVEQLKAA